MRISRIFGWIVLTTLACSVPSQLARAADKKIERTWKAKCASCHGEDGKAQTEQGKKMGVGDLTTPARQKEVTDAKIKKAVTEGIDRKENGKEQKMKSFKDELTADQIEGLITFIRGLAKP